MPVSDVLKGLRSKGYGSEKGPSEEKESSGGPRMIKLTDDEIKELSQYKEGEGQEIHCEVTGRLNGSEFSVSSVRSSGGGNNDEQEMAEKMMGPSGGVPLMQMQTMPSPS